MSLLYKLFGIVWSLDDLKNKLKRKKICQVDVLIWENLFRRTSVETISGQDIYKYVMRYEYPIYVRAGEIELYLETYSYDYWGGRHPFEEKLAQLREKRNAYRRSVDIAKQLQKAGLETTINSQPITETKSFIGMLEERLTRYEKVNDFP